jgi:acyl-coenzyme A synthetase/AMP-(fatty) acid ligase
VNIEFVKKYISIVSGQLSDYKQLRGGVVFLETLPLTATGKINRKYLKTLRFNVKPQ